MYPAGRRLVLLLGLCLAGGSEAGLAERVAQQPGNVLVDFSAYRHISIVHFDVPENAVSAGFKFTAKEEKTGGIGRCEPREIAINLKSGSLPLVRPDGSRIGAKLLENRRSYYTIKAFSNGDEHIFNITAPPPGDWYAIAYRSWSDPRSSKITQQGLDASCDSVLDAELLVEAADSVQEARQPGAELTARLTRSRTSAVLQFRVPASARESRLRARSSCGDECSVSVHVTAGDYLLSQQINASEGSFEFQPYAGPGLHYVTLRLESGAESNVSVAILEEEEEEEEEEDGDPSEVLLTRKSLPDFFLFDYEHLTGNSSKPAVVNLTAGAVAVLRFKVAPVYDTGGTLSLGLKLDDVQPDPQQNIVLVGCVSLGYQTGPSESGQCLRGGEAGPADIYVANRTSPGFVHVPYPEPGLWHLSVRGFCLGANASGAGCPCFEECARNASGCAGCECARDCEGRFESSLASSPCVEGGCSGHGRCVHYTSGGFLFSACHCLGGYRGFDCADDEYVLGRADVLTRLFMLTLSNLAFVGAVYVAIRRYYFTEALVYAAVMFFSTFYHACETSETGHSFCLMKLSVLQFCDFFNALLSIWVTLVAMAALGPRTTSFFHMLGVVILAIGAEMDRTALWVFLLPTVTGCTIVIVSWVLKCRQKGTFYYPARVYRLVFLPLGLLVVLAGLICYAFLQTRSNYYIVHSFWHVCVAVGVVLLLPKTEYMQ